MVDFPFDEVSDVFPNPISFGACVLNCFRNYNSNGDSGLNDAGAKTAPTDDDEPAEEETEDTEYIGEEEKKLLICLGTCYATNAS